MCRKVRPQSLERTRNVLSNLADPPILSNGESNINNMVKVEKVKARHGH